MMFTTLDRYLLWFFLRRAGAIAGALSAILLLFDVLANADDIVAGSGRVVVPLLAYGGLRLPEVIALVIPLSALLATLVTYANAVNTHEMVAIRGAGISIYRVTAALLFGACVLAAIHLWFSETVLPATSSRLELWQAQDYNGLPPRRRPQQAPTWFAVGDSLVQVGGSSFDGRRLRDIAVVQRNENGRMLRYLRAETARYAESAWHLRNIHRMQIDGGTAETVERMRLALPVKPKRFAALGERPGALTMSDLWRLARNDDLGGRPPHVYYAWFQRKIAHPLGALVMVLLAAPIGLQHARRSRMLIASLGSIGAGFLFFVAERLLLALGETGLLPTAMAVWSPAIVFSILASWVLLHYEG